MKDDARRQALRYMPESGRRRPGRTDPMQRHPTVPGCSRALDAGGVPPAMVRMPEATWATGTAAAVACARVGRSARFARTASLRLRQGRGADRPPAGGPALAPGMTPVAADVVE